VTVNAVIVSFPSLAPVVDEWRERTCSSKPSHGVPPHVTLLIPAPDEREAIAEALAGFGSFDVVFARFGRFEDTLWLAPEPAEPFVAMTRALTDAFPGHLPYGGGFDDVVPHLTVAQTDFDAAEAAVAQALPVSARVERASLFEQNEPPDWLVTATFPL
jgi:2'-5' RNA ligase